MVKMIKKYDGFVFEGNGSIVDHEDCHTIIQFSFKSYDSELAKKLCEKCLEWLNEEELP